MLQILRSAYEEPLQSPFVEHTEDLTEKPQSHLGKIGVAIMTFGLVVLYYDGISLAQTAPAGYQFYEHPQMHIPIIFMIVAFVGVGIFVYNFSKGRQVL